MTDRVETRRPLAVIDSGESTRTGHWYQTAKAPGELRGELFQEVGWLGTRPGERPIARDNDGRIIMVPAGAEPRVVPFSMPRDNTPRQRQLVTAIRAVEILRIGRRHLSADLVRQHERYLDVAQADLARLIQDRDARLADLKARQQQELEELGAARDRILAVDLARLDRLRLQITSLARAALEERHAEAARTDADENARILANLRGAIRARFGPAASAPHSPEPARPRVPVALTSALRERQELGASVRAATEQLEAELQESRRRWATLLGDTEGDYRARVRVAAQRVDSARRRLEAAQQQDRPRSYPGADGLIRTVFDREILFAARDANDEMRREPNRARVQAQGTELARRLDED